MFVLGLAVAAQASSFGFDTDHWSDVRTGVLALEAAREQLDHAIGTLVGELDAAGAPVLDGKRSMADWLATHTGQRRAITGSRAWLATRLRDMPATDAAVADGPEPAAPAEDVFHLSETLDGRLKGDFDFGGELAIRTKAVLDEITEQVRRRDTEARKADPADPRAGERAAQRRARALGELLDRAAVSPNNPARRQPLFSIVTTLETLTETGDPLAWKTRVDLAWRSAVPKSMLDRWTCDGHLARIVLDADGLPLDVGRSKRLATGAQRAALIAQYGACATPGCHAAPGQVEIHHIQYWDHDGPTDLDNLLPQCSWCHHRIHDGTLKIEIIDGRAVHRTSDNRLITDPRAGPHRRAA